MLSLVQVNSCNLKVLRQSRGVDISNFVLLTDYYVSNNVLLSTLIEK